MCGGTFEIEGVNGLNGLNGLKRSMQPPASLTAGYWLPALISCQPGLSGCVGSAPLSGACTSNVRQLLFLTEKDQHKERERRGERETSTHSAAWRNYYSSLRFVSSEYTLLLMAECL